MLRDFVVIENVFLWKMPYDDNMCICPVSLDTNPKKPGCEVQAVGLFTCQYILIKANPLFTVITIQVERLFIVALLTKYIFQITGYQCRTILNTLPVILLLLVRDLTLHQMDMLQHKILLMQHLIQVYVMIQKVVFTRLV